MVAPQLPPRVPPPSCLEEVDEPVPERTAPPEKRAVCAQTDRKKLEACHAAKARELARLKELDRQDKKVERERRRACVRFIEAGESTP